MRKQTGFTLLEIIIALAIFAILAMISLIALRSMTQNYHHLKNNIAQWQQLTLVDTLLQRDIHQIIDRKITDENGALQPAVASYQTNGIIFTHTGDQNPFASLQRSHLQRVAYLLKHHTLYRLAWEQLDRWPNTKSNKRTLLKHVKSLQIRYLDNHNQTVKIWPYALGSNALATNNNSDLPKAIDITLQLKKLGRIHWLIPINARGVYVQ